MKQPSTSKKKVSFLILGWLFVLSIVYGPILTQSRANAENQAQTASYDYDLQQGVGTEVQFAKAGDSSVKIDQSVQSLSLFMERRSGHTLPVSIQQKLAEAEASFLAGSHQGTTFDEFSPLMIDILFNKIKSLSNEEINAVSQTWAGFTAPGLPAKFERERVQFRSSLSKKMTVTECSLKLRELQNVTAQNAAREFLVYFLAERFKMRYDALHKALPQQFPRTPLSPVRVILMVYSMATDDMLSDSSDELREKMAQLHAYFVDKFGSYPSPNGWYPYGVNGYLYSSPSNLLLEGELIERIINKL